MKRTTCLAFALPLVALLCQPAFAEAAEMRSGFKRPLNLSLPKDGMASEAQRRFQVSAQEGSSKSLPGMGELAVRQGVSAETAPFGTGFEARHQVERSDLPGGTPLGATFGNGFGGTGGHPGGGRH